MSVEQRFYNAQERFAHQSEESGWSRLIGLLSALLPTGKILSNAAQYFGGIIFGVNVIPNTNIAFIWMHFHVECASIARILVQATTYRNLHANTSGIWRLWQHLGRRVADQRNLMSS